MQTSKFGLRIADFVIFLSVYNFQNRSIAECFNSYVDLDNLVS